MKAEVLISIGTALRLIPYLIVALVAWRRNYPWLVAAVGLSALATVIRLIFGLDAQTGVIIASIFSYCLLMHVLHLPKRGEKKT